MFRKPSFLIAALLVLGAAAGRAAEPASDASLLTNPAFERIDGQGWPVDWPKSEGVTFEKEGDTRFLRLKSARPGQMVMVYRRVTLPSPAPAALEFRLRLRHADIQSGQQKWNDGRVIAHFKAAGDRTLKPEPSTPEFRGSSAGWIERTYLARVPLGASYLEVMPCLLQAAAGTLDLAEFRILPATEAQLTAGSQIVPSETVALTRTDALPSELHVAGNRLLNAAGKEVWLQGLCVDSLEWSAGGEKIAQSIPVAIDDWKANVIRLPVRDDFWFGRGPGQRKDGGIGYRKVVDGVIEAASARGAYVALDLHRFGAPLPEHVAFWKDAATRYKNHPAVLFELFNEPHSLSWKLWRDGGGLTDPKKPAELTGEVTPGMQGLVDAVRSTGAQNVLIAGGLDWSYDLSGVLQGFALADRPGGRGIVYSSHIYPWKSDWTGKVLAAAEKYPLFVGEVGCPPDWKSFEFIPPSGRTEDLSARLWQPDVLGMIQAHRLNWTGFSFHPKAAPTIISDWQYTPTEHWGVFVKDALSGKRFEVRKLR